MTDNNSAHVPSRRTLLGTVAMAVLIGSGCLATVSVAADPGDGSGMAAHEQAGKYSACMRANGVGDFPDPVAEGRILYGGVSVPKTVWEKAVGACKGLEPSAWSDYAGRTPEQQEAALEFAQCMRDNGVPDFPDPASPRDALIDTSKMRGDVSARDIPELKGAQQACRDFFQAALPPLGTGRPG
jgi:hypothetical protein